MFFLYPHQRRMSLNDFLVSSAKSLVRGGTVVTSVLEDLYDGDPQHVHPYPQQVFILSPR